MWVEHARWNTGTGVVLPRVPPPSRSFKQRDAALPFPAVWPVFHVKHGRCSATYGLIGYYGFKQVHVHKSEGERHEVRYQRPWQRS